LKEITGELPEATPRQYFEKLRTELQSRRFLVILDGMERTLRGYVGADAPGATGLDVLLKDEERSLADLDFEGFLQGMVSTTPSSRSRILVTTRDVPAALEGLRGCIVERLDDLSEKEATDYLLSEGVTGESHEFAKAFAVYGRHHLGLKLLGGLVKEDYEASGELRALRKLELPTELKDKGRRHHILERAHRALPEDQRSLLGRLSLYRTVIKPSMLRVFNGAFAVQETLKKLVIRAFVERYRTERNPTLFDMHPVVRQFARQQFLATAPLDAAATHRMMAAFYHAETGEELADEFQKVPPQEERYVGPMREDAAGIRSIDEVAPTIE